MWKKGVFEGYGQKLFEFQVKDGIWKDTKLVTEKDKVPEKERMEFDYKYLIGDCVDEGKNPIYFLRYEDLVEN